MTTKRITEEYVIHVLRNEPNVKSYWEEWGSEFSADAAEIQKWDLEEEIGCGNVNIEKVWVELDIDGTRIPNGQRWRELLP